MDPKSEIEGESDSELDQDDQNVEPDSDLEQDDQNVETNSDLDQDEQNVGIGTGFFKNTFFIRSAVLCLFYFPMLNFFFLEISKLNYQFIQHFIK